MTDNTIEFRTTHNEAHTWVLKITADRRIEVNEDVVVTEVAKTVFEAVQWLLDKQKREWVGLTGEDRLEFAKAQHDWDGLLTAAEAKLKEKNQ